MHCPTWLDTLSKNFAEKLKSRLLNKATCPSGAYCSLKSLATKGHNDRFASFFHLEVFSSVCLVSGIRSTAGAGLIAAILGACSTTRGRCHILRKIRLNEGRSGYYSDFTSSARQPRSAAPSIPILMHPPGVSPITLPNGVKPPAPSISMRRTSLIRPSRKFV